MNRGCDTGGVIHRNNEQNMQDFRFSSQRCCWRFKRSEMWWCVNGRAVASILKACQSSSYEHSNLKTSDTSKDQNASIIMSQEVLEDSLTVKTKAQWFFKMLGTTCPRQSVTSHKTLHAEHVFHSRWMQNQQEVIVGIGKLCGKRILLGRAGIRKGTIKSMDTAK